ncbi:TPA: replication protein [Escherichia coli]
MSSASITLLADLTVRQMKVMLAIMRKTYGFNKPMDRLTNTQIAAMTGIHHTHVCAAKRQLIERKFLIADGVKIGVNKVVSQWISQDSLTLAKTANKTLAKSATLGQSWLSNQMSNYNNLANVGLGALQGQANAGQTYANNMSSIAQQSAALAAANANKPSSLQTAISGGTSGAIAGAGLASLLGTSTPWGAGIGAGIGLLGSLF